MLAFFGQLGWNMRAGGWLTALAVAGLVALGVLILAFVYRVNQHAVRSELEPRRQELEALLTSLQDESLA
jgi:hypothetical protein